MNGIKIDVYYKFLFYLYNMHSLYKQHMLLEAGIKLPDSINTKIDALTKYIVGISFVNYSKYKIKRVKTKTNKKLVDENLIYRLGTQYIKEGQKYFEIIQESTNKFIYHFTDKDNIICNIKVIYYTEYIGNIFNIIDGRFLPNKITHTGSDSIEFEIYNTNLLKLKDLNSSLSEIRDIVQHEITHYLQFKRNLKWGFAGTKLKNLEKITSNSVDPIGIDVNTGDVIPHPFRPIEFKTNVHTFANTIREYLNRNYKKSNWKEGFSLFLRPYSLPLENLSVDESDLYVKRKLNYVLSSNPIRWKQYVKEIYQLIFN